MSKDISQIVNELFGGPSEGKDLSAQIKRLGDELRKMLHSDDTTFGKLHGLLASFKDVIPDENQRYHAALKALSTTSKLDNKAIIKAFSGQLEELKIVEKGILPSLSGWSAGLKDMESRARELKGEITDLRAKLEKLEREEQTIRSGIESREKDLKGAERTVKELFADIAQEISMVNRKIGELTGEAVPEEPPPAKPSVKKKKKTEEKEQDVEIRVETAPMDPKYQRKCPMCGGLFNLHELEKLWQCYTCGHEEPAEGGEPASEPSPAAASGPIFDPSVFRSRQEPEKGSAGGTAAESEPIQKKPCPGCGRSMFYYPKEKAWRCNSCGYERRI